VTILRFLQEVDRRFLYALLILAVTIPFFLPLNLPNVPSPPTIALFNEIENLPPNAFVLLGVDWSAGTRGENLPQTEMLIRHLMKRKLRFALIDFADPQGKLLGEEIAQRLQGEYGVQEGVNWVNMGYRTSDMINVLKAFEQNVISAVPTDVNNRPLASLAVMQGIHTAHDISMVIDVTPSTTYQAFIQFLGGPYHIPMAAAMTAVMVPEAYNYFDSRQLVGMIPGLQGAAEYQRLFEEKYGKIPGTTSTQQFSNSLSFAHLLMILLIILGNVAMILERRHKARMGGPA